MPSLNKIMIIGNLGGEPEMRFTPAGKPVTSFNVATNRVYNTGEGERREETEWFTIVAWDKLAELCNQNLSKGQLVYVEGRFQSHSWAGQDGQKHTRSEIIANTVLFLSARRGAAAPPQEGGAPEGEGDIGPDDFSILSNG